MNLWLREFTRVWVDEVDVLVVCINSPVEEEVLRWMENRVWLAGGVPVVVREELGHGPAIEMMLKHCYSDDMVMLVEDDGFIRHRGAVKEQFDALAKGDRDLIGSPRTCTQEWLIQAADQCFGRANVETDTGPAFWPNFLFTKADYLRQAAPLGPTGWKAGERVEEVDRIAPADTSSDTMVAASLRLRKMGLSIKLVPQWHLFTDDSHFYASKTGPFAPTSHWFHVGSLSSGFNSLLKDPQGRSLGLRMVEEPRPEGWQDENFAPGMPTTEAERYEIERRVVWWLKAAGSFSNSYVDAIDAPLLQLQTDYLDAIDQLIRYAKLSRDRIGTRMSWYKELLNS